MQASTLKLLATPYVGLLFVIAIGCLVVIWKCRSSDPGVRAIFRPVRRAAWMSLGATLVLYAASIGAGAGMLVRTVEAAQPRDCGQSGSTVVILMASLNERAASADEIELLTVASFRRVVEGVRVAKAQHAVRIVLAGGGPPGSVPESRVGAELAVALGWPSTKLVTEAASLDTAGNAKEVHALLGGGDRSTVTLVTSALHMPRALASFNAVGMLVHGCSVDLTPFPWWSNPIAWVPQVRILQKTLEAWHEWVGLHWYRWTGRAK